MSTVNASVTAGYVFSYDADQKIWVTKDRLNLLGVPTATVNLGGAIAAEDLQASAVEASKLANAVADEIVLAVATVAAEAADNVDVTIQFNDVQGNALAAVVGAWIWLCDGASSYVPAALPSAGAPVILNSHGAIVQAMTASAPGFYVSNSSGQLDLRFTETGALTRYLRLAAGARVTSGSAALVWT